MGRNKRKRNKYRNRNNANNEPKMELGTAKILKVTKDKVLMATSKKTKYWINREHLYCSPSFIEKGKVVAINILKLEPIIAQRLIVTNAPERLPVKQSQPDSSDSYVFGHDIKCVVSQYDVGRLGLPIGTQYHYISFQEAPRAGDYVMGMVTGSYKHIRGLVTAVSESSGFCIVDDDMCPIEQIGYRIINPEFLESCQAVN